MDLEAHGFTRWRWWLRFSRPQLAYLRLLRRVEYWQTQGRLALPLYAVLRLRQARMSQRLSLSIPPGVFGPGLSLPHYGTIVVNDKARFGRYCRIHTSTNIGESGGQAPSGDDFVYLAPGAVLYGGISIGRAAVIGANSVVNADVPAGVTVAGAPARVISPDRGSEQVLPGHLRRLLLAEQEGAV